MGGACLHKTPIENDQVVDVLLHIEGLAFGGLRFGEATALRRSGALGTV